MTKPMAFDKKENLLTSLARANEDELKRLVQMLRTTRE